MSRDDIVSLAQTLGRPEQGGSPEGADYLRALFEESPVATALTRLSDGVLVRVNRAFMRLFELEPSDIGLTSVELGLAPEASRMDVMSQLSTRGVVRDFECVRTTRTGRVISILLDVTPVMMSGLPFVVSTVRDVTEQRRAEELTRLYEQLRRSESSLRRSEARAKAILAASPDAIIVVDAQHRIRDWNQAAELTFGYTQEEVIGRPLEILLPERFRAAHAGHVAYLARESRMARKMEQASAFALRKSGEEFAMSAMLSKCELDGEVIMTVSIRDMTDRWQQEQDQHVLVAVGTALMSLDYESALQQLASTLAQTLANFVTIFAVNDAATLQRIAVASRDPASAWIAERLMQVADELDPRHPVWTAFHERRTIVTRHESSDYAQLTDDPRVLEALQAAQPRQALFVPVVLGDSCIGVLALVASAQPLRARALDLTQEIARRVAHFIANTHLHWAKQRALRVRDEVLGVVAHDLRNPINNIKLQAQLLSRHESTKAAGARIASAANRLNRIVGDLLHVAQLESGTYQLESRAISSSQLLGDAAQAQELAISQRGLALRIEAEQESLPDVLADKERISQVFENLIGNALKHTDQGEITLGARPRERDVVFCVRDTGVGIAHDALPHVFDRFWHGRRTAGGIGLGLAIVRGIVEAHGGSVWAESQPGVGSAFYFSLPRANMA